MTVPGRGYRFVANVLIGIPSLEPSVEPVKDESAPESDGPNASYQFADIRPFRAGLNAILSDDPLRDDPRFENILTSLALKRMRTAIAIGLLHRWKAHQDESRTVTRHRRK